jgi:hypothetical protein
MRTRRCPPLRCGERVREVRAAAGFDRERLLATRELKLRRERLLGLRIEDLEGELALQLLLAGVVHHDLELRFVTLAEKARHVRPHHQLLDRLRLLLQRAAEKSFVRPCTQMFQAVTLSAP